MLAPVTLASETTRALPKSPSIAPAAVRKMFCGFTSRWMIPRLCA